MPEVLRINCPDPVQCHNVHDVYLDSFVVCLEIVAGVPDILPNLIRKCYGSVKAVRV